MTGALLFKRVTQLLLDLWSELSIRALFRVEPKVILGKWDAFFFCGFFRQGALDELAERDLTETRYLIQLAERTVDCDFDKRGARFIDS